MTFLEKSLALILQVSPKYVIFLPIVVSAFPAYNQELQLPEVVKIPNTATAIEGVPTVVVTSHESSTDKQALNSSDAKKNRLLVTIVNGKFFWASRENRSLHLLESGDFTYLYHEPGSYIKFTRWGTKIIYMEHVNILLSTKTYWGELKIITGG